MTQRTTLLALLTIAILSVAHPKARAAFVLIDGFDTHANNVSIDGLSVPGSSPATVWDTDPDDTNAIRTTTVDGSDLGLLVQGTSGGRQAVAPVGQDNWMFNKGTFFLQFQASDHETRPLDAWLGIRDGETTSNSPQAAIGFTDDTTGFKITTFDGSTDLENGLSFGTWYNLWLVADNQAGTGADEFDVYLNTGNASATAGDRIADGLAFPNQTSLNAIKSILLAAADGPISKVMTFDNLFWEANAENLANPTAVIPTPAALPAGLAMLGLAAMRRRR